jgi:glycosyltransferase involved in cell wall biosynthesis
LPVLEAAACGLPSICTGGGPTDEFTTEDFTMRIRSEAVSNELDGEVATSLRPDQAHLIRLMNRIVDDDDFRTTAREAAPAHVKAHFTWRHAVDKLLGLFSPL